MSRIRDLLANSATAGTRCLACFDFAFGYPAGFADHLPPVEDDQPWKRVWEYSIKHLDDDLGTKPGRVPSNRNNRFDVANHLNAMMGTAASRGPFWCAEPNWRRRQGKHKVHIPQQMPRDFVSSQGIAIRQFRHTDKAVNSKSPFCLFQTGSVGSQVMTGIPCLQRLRSSTEFRNAIKVWPFETGWATAGESWLDDSNCVVLAEIYPSVRQPLSDSVKDRGQVRAMWHWARDLDQNGSLQNRFARPDELDGYAEPTARTEEGWVLH